MTGTIPVGTRPRGVHVVPDGRRLYVALSDNAQRVQGSGYGIAVVDLATKTIVRRFDAGSDPEQFAVAPDGRRLYSANEDAGTATITEVATGKVLGTLVVGIEPEGVGIRPDGRFVYVTAETATPCRWSTRRGGGSRRASWWIRGRARLPSRATAGGHG